MKRAGQNERGDTLIEVLLGLTVLSLVIVSSIVLMNRGQAMALNALERSQVQAAMTSQGAMLNYLRDAYADVLVAGQSPQAGTAAEVWESIISNYATSPNAETCTPDGHPNHAADSFYLTYAPAPASNPIALTAYSGATASAVPTPGQGMWVEAQHVTGNQSYVDFFIKACWQPSGLGSKQEVKNVVRILAPLATVVAPPPVCVPTDIALVLDNSASMTAAWPPYASRAAKLEEAAARFVNEVGISSDVWMGIVTFTSTANLRQPLTNDIVALQNTITNMTYTPGTRYQAALQMARDQVLDGTRRRIMVFISDGQVDDIPTGPPQIVAITDGMKTVNNIAIYTIGIIASPGSPMEQLLDDMSGNGGFYAPANDSAQFDNVITSILGSIGCGP